MDIESEAEDVRGTLRERIDSDLYAVGWYDADGEPRTGAVYMNEEFTEAASTEADEHTVLDEALLGRFGPTSHDMLDEQLVASTDVYESFVDVHVCLDERRGIVVAVARESDWRIGDVVSAVLETVSDELAPPGAQT